MAFMGFAAVLSNLGQIRNNFRIAREALLSEKPDVLILVDYPSFNLKMADFCRRHLPETRIIYYIPPKVWAWKRWRIHQIARLCDEVWAIFPFEPAYYARYAAKNIVAAGLADRCQIQVAYAIGVDKPVSFCVKTFNTAADGVTDSAIEKILASGKVFDFRPYALAEDLGLLSPSGWCYEDTAAYGHFGRDEFPWERLDKVPALKAAFGV